MTETLEIWIARADELWRTLRQIIDAHPEEALVYSGSVIVALLLGFLMVRRLLRPGGDGSLARETRSARIAGYTLALLFFGGFGTWAATASLSGAALAVGVISPDGARKTVQHLEGGIRDDS